MTIKNLDVRVRGTIVKKGMWLGVDAMMIMYAMKNTRDIWRQQTQIPPVPQTGLWSYAKDWYSRHKFKLNDQVLVLVVDTRECECKILRRAQRLREQELAWQKVNEATTLAQLENKNALPKTATINGDLMFQLTAWVQEMRKRGNKIMLLGAPFEADAQLVQLQNQGLIDVILSQDGDMIMHGSDAVQFGECMYVLFVRFLPLSLHFPPSLPAPQPILNHTHACRIQHQKWFNTDEETFRGFCPSLELDQFPEGQGGNCGLPGHGL